MRPSKTTDVISAWGGIIALLAAVLAVAWTAYAAFPDLQGSILVAMTNLMLAVSLYAFAGNSGVLSFGHIGFAAIGAYTYATLVTPQATKSILLPDMPARLMHLQMDPFPAVLIAGLLAVAVALIFGAGILRLSGLGASIATFAMLLVVSVVASNWMEVTGGVAGLGGVPMRASMAELSAWVAVVTLSVFAFQRTRLGLSLRASREDEIAARGVGISVFRERMAAWLLSAFFAGVSGALIAQVLGSFAPNSFYLNLTFLIVAMLVIGGLTSLSGALVGFLVITVALEALRQVEQNGVGVGSWYMEGRPGITESGLALILLASLILRPQGVTRGRELTLSTFRSLRAARHESQPAVNTDTEGANQT